ncbi:MAG: SUMF1/EgtB/PvdO family nonheme iron enzyme, partial [Leptolyngbyaceae cyanobacterium MAG.088]|nr:SUMF1/EgtB/PvdO family nonheme iron enzyme [Leptolyngbyaceae cyanobacterium MAG.088]
QSLDESAPRVCRGGSWLRYPGGCRSAYRDYDAPAIRSSFTGFRVVCTDARI